MRKESLQALRQLRTHGSNRVWLSTAGNNMPAVFVFTFQTVEGAVSAAIEVKQASH